MDLLLVEDDTDHVDLFRARIRSAGARDLNVRVAHSLRDTVRQLEAAPPDVIVLDLGLPDSTGLSGLDSLVGRTNSPPVVVLTTIDNEHLGSLAVKHGAQDYLPKSEMNGKSILRAIRYAHERWAFARQREALVEQLQHALAAQERARQELDHRTRNLLTVILSLAHHTAKTTEPADLFIETFSSRLRQLANVHHILSQDGWRGLELESILRSVLAPHMQSNKQIELSGDLQRLLRARTVRPLALSLNELYTNAVKHGVLSSPEGRLHIHVQAHDDLLELRWDEIATRPVTPKGPREDSEGQRLVLDLIELELGGKVTLKLEQSGLQAAISIPQALQFPEPETQPADKAPGGETGHTD